MTPRISQLCKCDCGQETSTDSQGRPLKFVKGHREIFLERIAAESFWATVDMRGPDECWPWDGALTEKGYGTRSWHSRTTPAHRIAYLLAIGPIPDSLPLDHLCHDPAVCKVPARQCPHRRCCNPAHLEAVPSAVNNLRGGSPTAVNAFKTVCIHGHRYTEANTRIKADGARACRECDHDQHEKTNRKRRDAARRKREAVAA